MFDAQRFGQKNGVGFYRYEQDSKGKPRKVQDEQTAALLAEVAPSNAQFSDEEIIARMMIPMINEVVRCFEEKSCQALLKQIWLWSMALVSLRSTAAHSAT